MSSRVGSKVDRLLRAWGFGENVVQKFQEEEIDEEAFDCLDRRLIEILFKTVGAQAKFLKHYQSYLVDKQNSSTEVTEMKSEVRVKTETEDPNDLDSSDPGLITGDSPGPSHQSYESNPANIGNGRQPQEHSPDEETLEDTPYHVPEMVMSPETSPQYVQAAGPYCKRSYPFGVSYDDDGAKRMAMGSEKDESEQEMDVDWSRFPTCPFSADWVNLKAWSSTGHRSSVKINDQSSLLLAYSLPPGKAEDDKLKLAIVERNNLPINSALSEVSGRTMTNVTPEGLDCQTIAKEINLLDSVSPKSSPGRYNLRTPADRSATSSPSAEAAAFLACKSPDDIRAAASSSTGEKRTKIPKRLGADAKYLPESKKNLMQSCIPNIWPDDIARSIEEIHSRMEKGDVVPTAERLKREHRLYMIRKITGRAVDSGFTAEEFPWVADYVLQVIPALRSSVVPGSTALVVAMKECLRNRRGYEHKKAAKHQQKFATVSSCREAQQRMKQEVSKRNPSINVLKSCLRDARSARIAHAKDSTPTEHLLAYPALRKSELLFWEFSDMVKVPEDVLRYRWTSAVPKLLIHFKVVIEPESSVDRTTSMLLQIISMKMGSSKRGSRGEGVGDVFRVHEYESCIPKTWPDDLQMAIERNSLTSTQRNEIIRRIVDRMLGEGLRGDAHYKAVADVAISRFPCLGSALTGNLGLVNQLRACAKNKVYQAKRRARKEAGLLVDSKKPSPTKRKVKLSEIVENGKPISVVIDESTGDLVVDESEYDVSEALLVLSGDSPNKGTYYSPEKKSQRQTRSAEGELAQEPHTRELRRTARVSNSPWARPSPPSSRDEDYIPGSETVARNLRKKTSIPRLSKHILAFQATEELERLDLLTLLKTVSVETRAAVEYYESEGMLTEKHRSWITKVVTNHILHLNTSPSHQEYRMVAQKICQLFPSEQIETYFCPPDEKHRNAWGKLPHKVRNIKYQLSKISPSKSPQSSPAPILHTRPVVTQKKVPPSVELKDIDENDPKIKAAIEELKHNQESWPEILHNWEVTFPLRFNYLRNNECLISEYIKQWPVLSLPQAHMLYDQDFKTLYPENANGLLLRWKASKKLLIKLLNAEILKSDAKAWGLLQDLNKLPNELSDPTLLTLLSTLCSKRAVYAKGAKTKTSAVDKQTISSADAMNSFFIHVATLNDIDTQLDQQREKISTLDETLQPVVVCVGPSLSNIKASYLQVERVRYQLNTPIEAVDCCFKAIHSLHQRYSSPSIGVWYFLQRYFYELRTEFDPDIGRVTNLLSSLAGLKAKLEENDQAAQPAI